MSMSPLLQNITGEPEPEPEPSVTPVACADSSLPAAPSFTLPALLMARAQTKEALGNPAAAVEVRTISVLGNLMNAQTTPNKCRMNRHRH